MKLGEIQFLENITARRSLSVVGEKDFPASGNHCFSPFFKDSCQFFSVWYFSTKSFISTDRFSSYWKPFSFAQSFSSVETVTKINGSELLKKDHIFN